MKKVKFIAPLAIAALAFACNKQECKECHYEDASGNEVEIGQKCDEEIEEAEKNGFVTDSTTYEVHCGEH